MATVPDRLHTAISKQKMDINALIVADIKRHVAGETTGTLGFIARRIADFERIGERATSEVIYDGVHYTASFMRDSSLIVQSKRSGKGKRMVGPDAAHWADEIESAMDDAERHAICRAILNP